MVQPRAVLFDLISARAAWLGQRQAVLGQNVAHADTPGYWPRDLEPVGFAGLLARGEGTRLQPARTAAAHLAVAAAVPAGRFRDRVDEGFEAKPSGNGVDLPDQMRKLSTTELDHQLTTSLYRRYVGMVRTAIGVPQA
jgi:flagellar basal-body rod protein FlgB